MQRLYDYGLDEYFLNQYQQENNQLFLGRVIFENKGIYKVAVSREDIYAKVSGKLSYIAASREDYPAVGDWVVVDRDTNTTGDAVIHDILLRKSIFKRKMAGNSCEEQVLATNIDIVFICMALNEDFNLRRLERYLIQAWESNSNPIVVLTKADLCDDIELKVNDVMITAIGVDVLVTSSKLDQGIEDIKQYIHPGVTATFLGSSGIGKSTIINKLFGSEKQLVNEIREDGKGRHTTTHREMILLPMGGIVIDTPGMREFHLLDSVNSIDSSFADIEELSKQCKFNDCSHKTEPGCAIKKAIETGEISKDRFENFLKLKKEAEYMERKMSKRLQIQEKKNNKNLSKLVKRIKVKI